MRVLTLIAICLSLGLAQEPPKVKLAEAKPEAPKLTSEQRLKVRDAQISVLSASQKFSEYTAQLQRQVESLPEYQKLKAARDSAIEEWTRISTKVKEEAKCAKCDFDWDKGTLNPPAPETEAKK